jgi:hypothetical protein
MRRNLPKVKHLTVVRLKLQIMVFLASKPNYSLGRIQNPQSHRKILAV